MKSDEKIKIPKEMFEKLNEMAFIHFTTTDILIQKIVTYWMQEWEKGKNFDQIKMDMKKILQIKL